MCKLDGIQIISTVIAFAARVVGRLPVFEVLLVTYSVITDTLIELERRSLIENEHSF